MDSIKFPADYYKRPHPGLEFGADASIEAYFRTPESRTVYGMRLAALTIAQRDPIIGPEIAAGIFTNVHAAALRHVFKRSEDDVANPLTVHPFDSLQYRTILTYLENKYLPTPLKDMGATDLVKMLKTIAFNSVPGAVREENGTTSGAYRTTTPVVAKAEYFSSPEDAVPYLQQNDPGSLQGWTDFIRTFVASGGRHDAAYSEVARAFIDKYVFIPPYPSEVIDSKMKKFAQKLIQKLSAPECDPVDVAGWAHMKIVRYHPFPDANGRTASTTAAIICLQAQLEAPDFSSERLYTAAVEADNAAPGTFTAYLRGLIPLQSSQPTID